VFSVIGEVARVAAAGDGTVETSSIPVQPIDRRIPAIERFP
jgi:hypothetical protein